MRSQDCIACGEAIYLPSSQKYLDLHLRSEYKRHTNVRKTQSLDLYSQRWLKIFLTGPGSWLVRGVSRKNNQTVIYTPHGQLYIQWEPSNQTTLHKICPWFKWSKSPSQPWSSPNSLVKFLCTLNFEERIFKNLIDLFVREALGLQQNWTKE